MNASEEMLDRAERTAGRLRKELEKKEFLLGETLDQLRFEQAEAAEKGKRIEELERDLFTVLDDNTELSNDNKPHCFEPSDDLEPVYATLHFYYNDPDSMRRMRECLDAPNVSGCVREFEEWLRRVIDYDEPTSLEDVRNELFKIFNQCGLSPWEE